MWSHADLSYQLWPQQEIIYNGIRDLGDEVTEVVILCARQFGKSHLAVLLAIEDCLRYPNCCIPIISPTEKQAREIVTPRLKEIAKDAPAGLIRPSKSEGKWYIGTSEIVLGGFDNNSSAQRGKTVQNIYIEEVVDSDPDDYTESMRSDLSPALTHSKGGKIFLITTLPKIPDHPFVVETIPKAKLRNSFYSYDIYDNKQLSLQQFIRCAELAGCVVTTDGTVIKHSIDWQREYLNQVVRDPRVVVIPDFDEKLHVKPFLDPPSVKWQIFGDWGGVRDKTVAHLIGYDFHRNVMLVRKELVFEPNISLPIIHDGLNILEKNMGVTQRVIDMPGQVQVDLIAREYMVTTPNKQDWQSGINNIQNMFRQNRIEVHPDCKFTIVSLSSGQFNKQKTDFGRNSVLGHCDALASLMYAGRQVDVTNPFPRMTPSPDGYFVRSYEKDEETKIGEAIQPKSFMQGTTMKKFGSFRK